MALHAALRVRHASGLDARHGDEAAARSPKRMRSWTIEAHRRRVVSVTCAVVLQRARSVQHARVRLTPAARVEVEVERHSRSRTRSNER
jgi:hypothetical protein